MNYNIAICVPTRGLQQPLFVGDLFNLTMCTQAALKGDDTFGLLQKAGTYIDSNRNDLVAAALDHDPTHILFVDDDMRFPPEALLRLLIHNVPIVGINYVTRGLEAIYVAIEQSGRNKEGKPAKRFATLAADTGLGECMGIGFGFVLIQRKVFDVLNGRGFKHRWFLKYYDKESDTDVGEDIDFCDKARAAGFKIMVDHDLSKDCAHIGSFEYRLQHAWAKAEADAQKAEK